MRWSAAATAAVAVVIVAFPEASATTASGRCTPQWRAVARPAAELFAVAPLSTTDVWAVGYKLDDKGIRRKEVIGHWDGAKFSLLPAPPAGELAGLAAVSRRNVWLIEQGYNTSTIYQWDGTRWQRRSTPSGVRLTDIAMKSAKLGWAVGFSCCSDNAQPAILKWNGQVWKKRVLNTSLGDNELSAVATEQPNDAWAVGVAGSFEQTTDAFAIHWNGRNWKIIPGAARGAYDGFGDVAAASPTEAWAIQHTNGKDIIQHSTGRRWGASQVLPLGIDLGGVVAFRGEAWAVGQRSGHPFLLHWNGKAWTTTHSTLDNVPGSLEAASALSRHAIWAVGSHLLARYSC